jgi:hypothetical protein
LPNGEYPNLNAGKGAGSWRSLTLSCTALFAQDLYLLPVRPYRLQVDHDAFLEATADIPAEARYSGNCIYGFQPGACNWIAAWDISAGHSIGVELLNIMILYKSHAPTLSGNIFFFKNIELTQIRGVYFYGLQARLQRGILPLGPLPYLTLKERHLCLIQRKMHIPEP